MKMSTHENSILKSKHYTRQNLVWNLLSLLFTQPHPLYNRHPRNNLRGHFWNDINDWQGHFEELIVLEKDIPTLKMNLFYAFLFQTIKFLKCPCHTIDSILQESSEVI